MVTHPAIDTVQDILAFGDQITGGFFLLIDLSSLSEVLVGCDILIFFVVDT